MHQCRPIIFQFVARAGRWQDEGMEEKIQIRVHGGDSLPALVYLPGLHGDWTLVGSFRKHVLGRVRFAEMTYPRTLAWSLDDYAAAIESALAENGIAHGWLLGESFGSQPLWAIAGRGRFKVDGIILAGGFVRLPTRPAVRFGERVAGRFFLSLLTRVIFPAANRTFAWLYVALARLRFRRSPETLARINEFIERRTPLDLQAACHRLRLIGGNDPCATARATKAPIYALAGWWDPIVPWLPVRRWLRANCPSFQECKIIGSADHAVLVSAPRESAEQVLKWVR